MTFLIYTEDTDKVIARSAVRSVLDPKLLNLREEPDHIKEYFNTYHQLDRLNLEMNFEGITQPTEGEPKGLRILLREFPTLYISRMTTKTSAFSATRKGSQYILQIICLLKPPPKIL